MRPFDEGTLASETRTIERQLEALCFYSTEFGCPTNAGIILFGKNPLRFLPGDYIQFVQFAGKDRASDIVNQQMFRGCLLNVLPEVDTFVKTAIAKNRPVPVTILREKAVYDYPKWPIRELMMNAIMHRDYRSTGPTMFYQYADRIELLNSGGLYGRVNRENFPDENDYRNPIIADAMRTLGYVNRFGRGIWRVRTELLDNGNGEPLFDTAQIGSFRVSVGLTKFAISEQTTLDGMAESSQKNNERAENVAERAEKNVERAENEAECTEKDMERAEKVKAWALNMIPSGVRQDARSNMASVMAGIGMDEKITTKGLMHLTGLSDRGVRKTISALKAFGLLVRVGADRAGHWEVVGFDP